jgi:hypothetical protein
MSFKYFCQNEKESKAQKFENLQGQKEELLFLPNL